MKQLALLTIALLMTMFMVEIPGDAMELKKLTAEEELVIVHRGTELPFTGEYLNNKEPGTYTCRRCGASLYKSADKFESGCGWPAFDDEIAGAVTHKPDTDGRRVEIVCAACNAHLGHVFVGEGLTSKNTRHCVNSISLHFVPERQLKTETAIFAAGCFWGVEHLMKQTPGVISTEAGYTGGRTMNPDYQSVCSGTTGHIEAVKIDFDPSLVTFEQLCKLFFEIHDFSQEGRQGPDIGEQYKSVIFYANQAQQKISETIISSLKTMGHSVSTELRPATEFWPAEDYHQDYYIKTGKTPYCHIRRKIF